MAPVRDEKGFAGDLISMTSEKNSFNELYAKRMAGEVGVKVRRDFLAMDHSKAVTLETFESLNKDINQVVGSRGMKTRRRYTRLRYASYTGAYYRNRDGRVALKSSENLKHS